eukprot:TRINITY_DN67123_c0_g2_i3.p1 TRINITY_DN67123_c0_g2~~TRINITY_DN67123_c0_g2_i3.p1  ORF type:complete len:748 (+),score=124.56 TRINITY_DN67123_c0_g2_i3:22-2244(+)
MSDGKRSVGGWCAVLVMALLATMSEGITAPNGALMEVTRFAGKTPDTCVGGNGVGFNAANDCSETTPDAHRTLIIPSETTTGLNTIGNGQLSAGTYVVTVQGQNLNNAPAGSEVCLGQYDSNNNRAQPCGNGCDPNFAFAAVTANPAGTQMTFTLPTGAAPGNRAWNTVVLELEAAPRRICWRDAAGDAVWLGVNLGVAFSCSTAQDCNRDLVALSAQYPQYGLLQEADRIQIQYRNGTGSCCRTAVGFNNGLEVGTCINPRIQTCCGAAPIFPGTSKCCNPANEWVAYHESFCPCMNNDADCPAAEPSCCNATKYIDFAQLNPAVGSCYNQSRHSCCDTGHVYDPGSFQCCSINGLQSLNVPCPCEIDLHCASGTHNKTLDFACCKQTAPLPYEEPSCTTYANFPSGTGAYQAQRCTGVCIDTTYQICCNGVVCRREYEKCCNSTCCNRFLGTCHEAIRPNAVGNQYNWVEFGVKYEQCSHIEQLSALKAFWVFVLPVALLIMTLIGLALMLVFANKAAARSYSFIEAAMIGVAALAIVFALPTFFSPLYKYGVLVVFAGLITIAAAAVRVPAFNVIAVVVLLFVLLHLIDPFHGNNFLNFASLRTPFGEPDPEAAGIFHATGKLFRNDSSVRDVMYCTQWYDYFRLDPQLRDTDRYDNPYVRTYGYCGRPWIIALYVFEAILFILALLLFVIALIGLLLRFRSQRFEPVELEVRGTDAPMGMGGMGGFGGFGDDDLLD